MAERQIQKSLIGDLGGVEMSVIPVPNDVIRYEFCNPQITEFPALVYLGNALCPKCFPESKEGIKKETKGRRQKLYRLILGK